MKNLKDKTSSIKKVAKIFEDMQQTRIELISRGDHKSLLLANLLEKMKESYKEDFCKITLEE